MQERIMTLKNWKIARKYTIITYRFTIIQKENKKITSLSPADGRGMSSAFSKMQTCPRSFELHQGLCYSCWVPGMQMFADHMTWSLL